jgi:putative transposase
MILTYRYNLLPTRQGHAALGALLEDQRRLYNDALAERIDAYRRTSLEVERGLRSKPQTITFFDQTNSLTTIRNDPLTCEEFSKYPAFLQRWTLKRLDDAYKAFFRRVKSGAEAPGFPRFRARHRWNSFGSTVQGGNSPVSFDGRRVQIGSRYWTSGVRAHVHRPLPEGAILKAAVFTRSPSGRKWTISLQCEIPETAVRRCRSTTAAIGLDVGVSTAIVQSDGGMIPAPASIKRARKAERRAQRALARAKRGSKRRAKTRQRFAACKAKTAAIRREWQHKQAARLTRSYALVAIEDLAVSNMTRSARGTVTEPGRNVAAKAGLNRSILDVGWTGLREKLAYKAVRDGSRLVVVDPRYTSQDCSGCGARVPKTLAQRTHHCPACGLVLDRDENAAKNILTRAVSEIDAGWPARGQRNGGTSRRAVGNTGDAPIARLPDGGGNPATPLVSRRAARPSHLSATCPTR